jgi:glycosylphosphatidylinositol phospholipase D
MRPIARLVVLAAALALPAKAQQLFRSVPGPAANALFGKACITVPDQNGDGIKDLLVGAPGFNSGRGAIYCISGAYLAFGTGTQTLWSVQPTANPGDRFGFALANVGDVTGDGVVDFLVGQPGYDTTTQDVGAIRLINGSSHAVVSLIYGITAGGALGSAMAACGDPYLSDGKSEVAVGAPGALAASSIVYVVAGNHLVSNGSVSSTALTDMSTTPSTGLGTSIVSGFDLDGDGLQELAVGEPGWDGPGATDAGRCRVCSVAGVQITQQLLYPSTIPGEHLGQSLDGAHDYDGDGVVDLVIGAPNSPGANNTQPGRIVVISGAKLVAQTPPYELYSIAGGPGSIVPASYHFGAAVCASGDLNNDGVGDILVGSPDFFSTGNPGKGAVSIYSGATGVRIAGLIGANNDRIGDALAGALADFDGDGFDEFVVAGSLSDAGGTDSGVVDAYKLFPTFPSSYCTGKLNSLGCTPTISVSGNASASSSTPFLVGASNVINQKSGLLFYSHGPTSALFQGGFKCVHDPIVRTLVQGSGGSASGSDCTGTYSFDFNAWIQSGGDSTLVAGAEVFGQYWSRDPLSPSTTSLSNAVRFLINP